MIERPDKTVEWVSRSRVVLAPKPRTVDEIHNAARPLTDEEITPDTFPVEEEITNDGTPTNENQTTEVGNCTTNSTQPRINNNKRLPMKRQPAKPGNRMG